MRKKIAIALIGLGMGWNTLSADVSEMIFYPEADFSEGIFHFNYQGEKNKNYGFMFEKGFDPERIVYIRPADHRIEKLRDGMLKISFPNTDRYSYLERAYRDDFIVSDENGIVKILLSGGDCKSSPECVTAENILTINVPKGYSVRSLQGLDQDLKPLKNPQWSRKGNTFTLTAREVKGACIMMELERLKAGQAVTYPELPTSASSIKVAIAEKIEQPKPVEKPAPKPKVAEPAVPKSATTETTITPPLEAATVTQAEPKERPKTPVTAIEKPKASENVVKTDIPVDSKSVKTPEAPAAEKKTLEKIVKTDTPLACLQAPASYFRNFQLFENQAVVALSNAGKERLDEWVKAFKAGGYKSVTINGYTDSIPPKRLKYLYATNEIISEARAKAVADYLATQGIDASRITVNGKGALDPVAPNDTEEGRSKNRRIEFSLN